MITLEASSKTPIYEQIIEGVKALVMMGKMHPHEQLPSVRRLARELGINPNTVQKAYARLRGENLIYSVAGKGDFVADNASRIRDMKRDEIREMFIAATRAARDAGMWTDEIFQLVDEAYSSR
ncbi:MAG: GntR family transcriptional regulator [Christensenella sp.]|nr:GntR family transcriptional regulator [Christensenella sp.]